MLRKQAAGGLGELPQCTPASTQNRLDTWLHDLEDRQRQKQRRQSITDLLAAPNDPNLMNKRRGSHSPRIQRAHSQHDQGMQKGLYSGYLNN